MGDDSSVHIVVMCHLRGDNLTDGCDPLFGQKGISVGIVICIHGHEMIQHKRKRHDEDRNADRGNGLMLFRGKLGFLQRRYPPVRDY